MSEFDLARRRHGDRAGGRLGGRFAVLPPERRFVLHFSSCIIVSCTVSFVHPIYHRRSIRPPPRRLVVLDQREIFDIRPREGLSHDNPI